MKNLYLFVFLLIVACSRPEVTAQPQKLAVGAEQFENYLPALQGKRVALTVNHTSLVGEEQTHLLDTLLSLGVNVVAVFAPEHGFRGTADAGETVKGGKDVKTGVAILSLYGNSKKPSAAQMKDIDVVLFDIQDVGARFYTYISTMHYVMEACAEYGKQMMVLDRPNPCDYVEGPVLQPKYKSFVGMHPIPILHGCTVGELASMINGEGWLVTGKNSCNLEIIRMQNWKHGDSYSLPVKPSPNLPNDQSIRLYPSLCLFEATNMSIGRGTTFPFQVIGAPDKKYGTFEFTPVSLPGFDKNPLHKDKVCYGVDLREADVEDGFSLSYFLRFYEISGQKKAFFSRPNWFDLLVGNSTVREDILKGYTQEQITSRWQEELNRYKEMRRNYLIYEE